MNNYSSRRWVGRSTFLISLFVLSHAVIAAPPVVRTVPWVATQPLIPHDTWSGETITLKGTCNVQNGTPAGTTYTYVWDFGDGSPVATGTVSNKYVIEAKHAYTGASKLVYTATLTVQNMVTSEKGEAKYYVTILDKALPVEVNIAIDEGLWYLWKAAGRSSGQWWWSNSGGGSGYDGYYGNPTASAVQAFEIQGHLENQPWNPYSEAVTGGIDYLTAHLTYQGMSLQGGENPDSNGNGIGLSWNSGRSIYESGAVMDALVASGTPNATARTGNATYVNGKTYKTIVQDMVDMYAWGQGDLPNYYGSWQYDWNYGNDNSASQWAAIGMIAAERHFGCTVPQWVKDRNLPWLNASYNSGGYFGYTSTGANRWYSTGPCGMVQLAFDGKDVTDAKWVSCVQTLAANWSYFATDWHDARYYSWYSFAKAMRVALPAPVVTLPGGKDWYGDNVDGLARLVVNTQQSDGNWPHDGWPYVGYQTATGWNVIILSPTLFKPGSPVAVAKANPNPAVAGQTIQLDGSDSYHQDSAKLIDSWEWDLNNDGVYDLSGPFATVSFPAVGNYPIKLKVTDNATPQEESAVTTLMIMVNTPPISPTAAAGGPYSLCPGAKPWFLDATASVNPDDGMHQTGPYPEDFIKSYAWDLDGDGAFDDATGAQPDVTAFFTGKGPGSYLIQLKVTDNTALSFPGSGYGDLSDTDSSIVTILSATDPNCTCVNNLAARAKPGKVQLTWTHTGAHHYNVYRGTIAGGPYLKIASTTSTYSTYLDLTVVNNTTYYYVVREADFLDREECQSNQASARPTTR